MAIFTIAFSSGDELNIDVPHFADPYPFAATLEREGFVIGTEIGFVPSGDGKSTAKPYGAIAVLRAQVKTIRLHD
ncbi:MAG: hypothetical protein IT534_03870 [Bauldia sp.]|nr:hypothetical protein [Bauldia sp.]